jgi:hypothetical protein
VKFLKSSELTIVPPDVQLALPVPATETAPSIRAAKA